MTPQLSLDLLPYGNDQALAGPKLLLKACHAAPLCIILIPLLVFNITAAPEIATRITSVFLSFVPGYRENIIAPIYGHELIFT